MSDLKLPPMTAAERENSRLFEDYQAAIAALHADPCLRNKAWAEDLSVKWSRSFLSLPSRRPGSGQVSGQGDGN